MTRGGLTTMFFPKSVRFAAFEIGVCALAVRLALMFVMGSWRVPFRMEFHDVVLAFADGRGFSDPFLPMRTGPTAMYMPGHVLVLSALAKLFGTGTGFDLSEQIFYSVLAACLYASLPYFAIRLGLPMAAGWLGGLAGALLPLQLMQEIKSIGTPIDAIFLLILLCYTLTACETNASGWPFLLKAGMLWVAAIYFNPIHLACLAGYLLTVFIRGRHRGFPGARYFAIVIISLIVGLAPWAYRNHRELGQTIWLRSSLGLELYLSFHPGYPVTNLTGMRSGAFAAFHPNFNPRETELCRSLGEAAYMKVKMKEGLGFIRDDPARAIRLVAARTVLFWFPYTLRVWQMLLMWISTVCSLLALYHLMRRPERWNSLLIFASIFCYPLLYYIVQADPRYRLPLQGLLWILAGLQMQIWYERFKERRRDPVLRNPK